MKTRASAVVLLLWILWQRGYAPPGERPFEPIEAFNSKSECERAAVAAYKNTKYGKQIDGTEIIQTLPYGALYKDASGKTTMVMEHRCLPETIDPRSRK